MIHRFTWSIVFFPTVMIWILCARSGLATQITIDTDRQLTFADQLFEQGQYQRAGQEYQRFVFFFPADPRQRSAAYKAGLSFFKADDIDTAVTQFMLLTKAEPLDKFAVEAYFMLADCHLALQAPGQAIVTLYNLCALNQEDVVRDRAYYRIGWIRIEQLEWPEAIEAFEHLSAAGQSRYSVGKLQSALTQTDQIDQKNPRLAGLLSILPGAGQLYCDRYEDALAAFLVNTGLIWAAYESFDHDLNALGGLLAFVGVGFYAGNIYGAVSDAHKYNRHQRLQFVDHLKQTWSISVAPLPQASLEGVLLKLQFRF